MQRPLAHLSTVLQVVVIVMIGGALPACGAAAAEAACEPQSDDQALTAAVNLGTMDDAHDAALSHSGDITACRPASYFRFHGTDTSIFDVNHPKVQLTYTPPKPDDPSKTLELCVYVMCSAGGASVTGVTCDTEAGPLSAVMSPDGFPGCCKTGPGYLMPGYACDNGLSSLTSDDSADFLVHVCTRGGLESSFDIAASF